MPEYLSESPAELEKSVSFNCLSSHKGETQYSATGQTKMTSDRETEHVSREATGWLIQIRESPEDSDLRARFEDWLAASSRNRDEWERTCRMWQVSGLLQPENSRPSATSLAAARTRRRRTGGRASALVFGVVAVCLLSIWIPNLLILWQSDYRTGTSETRSVTLDDGSTLTMAPDTAVTIDFSAGKRSILLIEGEAFFDVQHDGARSFVVRAGGLDVEVLGTAFDISLDSDSTRVSLERGSVRASETGQDQSQQNRLSPGHMLVFNRASRQMVTTPIDPADIGAWRQGRLFVVNQTIASVVEQIQRYHPAWISVPDNELAAQRVTGIYDLTAPDDALGALVDPYGGKVRKIANIARVVSRF